MRTGNKIREIARWLSCFQTETKILGFLNMHDRSIDAERILGHVLSIVLSCPLKDMNHQQKNHPAIDLGNKEAGIAVQITTNKTALKIQQTLDAFFRHELDRQFPERLIILVLDAEKSYKNDFVLARPYPFERARDIWNLSRLMDEICQLEDDRIGEIHSYLEKEMENRKTVHHDITKIIVREEQNMGDTHGRHSGSCCQTGCITGLIILVVIAVIVIFLCGIPQFYYPIVEYLTEKFNVEIDDSALLMYDQIDTMIDEADLEKMTAPILLYTPELNASDNLMTFMKGSAAYPMVAKCFDAKVNPIEAFQTLVDGGLYEKLDVEFDSFAVEPENPKYLKKYQSSIDWFRAESEEFGQYRADSLLTDIITLSGKAKDGLNLEEEILGRNSVEGFQTVCDSWSDHCYYNYYVYYGPNTAHILCIKMRTGDEKNRLTDIEFQLLNLRYCGAKPLYGEDELELIERRNATQVTSLIMAIENLLAGESAYDRYLTSGETAAGNVELVIPTAYSLGDYQVSITQTCYESAALGEDEDGNCVEQGTLVTYRIHK